ncbi:MAG TPA: hypothetical protein VMA75_00275 [Candidatus Paceibacterota bacterium]|nr:hypothetical protein [Candidatus Paceibacterota bacterium]
MIAGECQCAKPVNPKLFEEFERAMTEEVIPEIVEIMTLRARLANESREKFIDR